MVVVGVILILILILSMNDEPTDGRWLPATNARRQRQHCGLGLAERRGGVFFWSGEKGGVASHLTSDTCHVRAE